MRSRVTSIAAGLLLCGCMAASEEASRTPAAADGSAVPTVTTDVVYGHKAGLAMTFDVFRPPMPNGAAVISIVSGGWRSSWETLQQFEETSDGSARPLTAGEIDARGGILPSHSYLGLTDAGFTVFSVRHGSSPWFGMPEIVADMRRAVRFIRGHAGDYGIDPERIGVWGGSAGGHLSLLLGTTGDMVDPDAVEAFERGPARVAAVVAYAPPTDLVRWAVPERRGAFSAVDLDEATLRHYSPVDFITSDDAPALIVHGDADTLVPMEQGQSMSEALRGAGVESRFVPVAGAGHGFNGADAVRANDEMVAWFEAYLLSR